MKQAFDQLPSSIIKRGQTLSALTHCIRELLPIAAHPHFHVTRLDHQHIYLVADNPVWATRIRQLSSQILARLLDQRHDSQYANILTRVISPELRHLHISTRPGGVQSPSSTHTGQCRKVLHPLPISQRACQHLAQAAESISDESLREAMLKLSRQDSS